MDRPRPRLSELSSHELSQRAMEYRRMALTARGQATIKSLNMLAARYAMLAAKHEVEEAFADRAATDLGQSEVDKLARLAERAAAGQTDPVQTLVKAIRLVADSDADPYLVVGALVEGAVHTLQGRVPTERQGETALAMLKLVEDRLRDTCPLPRSIGDVTNYLLKGQ